MTLARAHNELSQLLSVLKRVIREAHVNADFIECKQAIGKTVSD